ncbi:hypothetical protein JQS43_11290 [Natronosporangium hydrolyticum]|uniref:Uncharacterized protein n=1 Tax=Natronosporangium hydrolyticum TaxID=2811111 RepID=A0A895YRS0_9ACTN|nr:hypothetical protein [Natronosporangium hydrolyticum]QSB16810.1 hypothetical protein JQS43_11290 [Natronosporangium hydrolyticum]
MYQTHETPGYQGSDYPTQELTYLGKRTNRSWLFVGAVSVAALLLLLFVVVACRGGDAGDPIAAVGAGPSASPTSVAASPSATPAAAPTGGGNPGGGADPGGGNPGNPGGGGNAGDPGDPEPPAPAPLQVTASVAGPPPNPGCAAQGTYTLTGGEYPVEVVYLWVRMQSPGGGQPPLPLPFGGQQAVLFEGPGQRSVQSPDFPADAGQNQVQLRVLALQAAASGLVTYPTCTELGLSN